MCPYTHLAWLLAASGSPLMIQRSMKPSEEEGPGPHHLSAKVALQPQSCMGCEEGRRSPWVWFTVGTQQSMLHTPHSASSGALGQKWEGLPLRRSFRWYHARVSVWEP